jgi:hypothetical protein
MPAPLRNVTLEMSPKPFKVMDDAGIEAVSRELFRQWDALTRHADAISVLLWTADGSEILDYRGDRSEQIEWARYAAMANPHRGKTTSVRHDDPDNMALHSGIVLYTDDPPVLTYGTLATIVATLKRVGREATGKPIRVGATFDPGDEFAISTFKYLRHGEICLGDTRGKATFVCCYGVLHGDRERYAGYPDGIPEGTPFGAFFGRQCQHFLSDLGFDYIWFSNGFGFGSETWATTGVLFDGSAFDPRRAEEARAAVVGFWRHFRSECPRFRIEARGSNLSIGTDLASDAAPWSDIYRGNFNVLPPPNSPWAAIDGDFGLELTGYMARIAELPGDHTFPFRFYLHDPWWQNSPWTDRYESQPHDITLPMAVSRIDSRGRVETASHIQFLTVDNTWGEIPVAYPNAVIPHILRSREEAPDRPGPLVWVYPFDEYHELTFGAEPRLSEVFFGDWFVRGAINMGLPLNTVISTRNLVTAAEAQPDFLDGAVLVAPVPQADSTVEERLLGFASRGGQVLLYGPTDRAGHRLLDALRLGHSAPISGVLEIDIDLPADRLTAGSFQRHIEHRELMCGGGISETLRDDPAGLEARAVVRVRRGEEERVAGLVRPHGSGRLAWLRGTLSNTWRKGERLLTPDDPARTFRGELLARWMLAELGLEMLTRKRDASVRDPITTVHRNRNAYHFSGYCPNTTVEQRYRFPQGAPLLTGYETELVAGYSTYSFPRAWRCECRVFVRQEADGQLSCAEYCALERRGLKRRLLVKGLREATVRFYGEPGFPPTAFLKTPDADGTQPFNVRMPLEHGSDAAGPFVMLRSFSGDVMFGW